MSNIVKHTDEATKDKATKDSALRGFFVPRFDDKLHLLALYTGHLPEERILKTQAHVAKALGIGPSTINPYVQGDKIPAVHARPLLTLFGVPDAKDLEDEDVKTALGKVSLVEFVKELRRLGSKSDFPVPTAWEHFCERAMLVDEAATTAPIQVDITPDRMPSAPGGVSGRPSPVAHAGISDRLNASVRGTPTTSRLGIKGVDQTPIPVYEWFRYDEPVRIKLRFNAPINHNGKHWYLIVLTRDAINYRVLSPSRRSADRMLDIHVPRGATSVELPIGESPSNVVMNHYPGLQALYVLLVDQPYPENIFQGLWAEEADSRKSALEALASHCDPLLEKTRRDQAAAENLCFFAVKRFWVEPRPAAVIPGP